VLSVILMSARGFGAEIEINADDVFPQVVTINPKDSVRWLSSDKVPIIVASLSDDYRLQLSQENGWSVIRQFDVTGTNFYRANINPERPIGVRSGIIVVRDRGGQPPQVTINSPVEGFVFNYGPEIRREPIPLLASSDIDSNDIARVEFVSNGALVATVTNAPYFVPRADLALGAHTLVARLVERSGRAHESDPVHISVQDIQARHLAIEHIKDKNLVLVSWVTPADRQWYSMARSANVFELKGTDTSSASAHGVRIWVERIFPDTMAFFSVRIRH